MSDALPQIKGTMSDDQVGKYFERGVEKSSSFLPVSSTKHCIVQQHRNPYNTSFSFPVGHIVHNPRKERAMSHYVMRYKNFVSESRNYSWA